MAVTRAMCDKSVEPTSDAGVSTSPLRNPATPTKNASPRKLPVPRPSPTKNLCEACRLNEVTIFKSLSTSDNDIFSFDNLSLNIKTSIYDLEMDGNQEYWRKSKRNRGSNF